MTTVTIDRSRPLREEPRTGHNRWHPDIPPIVTVEEGEEIALETRDATDGYLNLKSSEADFAGLPVGAIHPVVHEATLGDQEWAVATAGLGAAEGMPGMSPHAPSPVGLPVPSQTPRPREGRIGA